MKIYKIKNKSYTSLKKLCKEHDLPYWTVWRRIQAYGEDAVNGIDVSELIKI